MLLLCTGPAWLPPLRARDFEAGLSLEEMLRLGKERQREAAQAAVAEAPALTPEVLLPVMSRQGLKELAQLPCVFTPSEEGQRDIGCEVELKFWQDVWQSKSGQSGSVPMNSAHCRTC